MSSARRTTGNFRWLLGVLVSLAGAGQGVADEVRFLQDVAPVLTQRCVGCHGSAKARADYRLDTFKRLLESGASGEKTVVPGRPGESELYRRLTEKDAKKRMPPGDDSLSKEEVEAVRRWIAGGAKFDGRDQTAALKSILPPRKHPAPPEKYPVAVPVFALAFSPDGKELSVGGHHEVTVWGPQTGKLLRRLRHLPQRVQALAYDREGKRLLVGGGSPGEYGEVSLVDAGKGTRLRTFGTFDDLVLGVAFSPDFRWVAAGSADRWARAYATEGGTMRWQAQLHSDWVTAVAFSPDGRFLVTASKDKTLKVLDVSSGALFTTYNGHRRQLGAHSGRFEVHTVAFGKDAATAYSAGEGKAIRVWGPERARAENGTAGDMEERFAGAGHTRYVTHGAAKPVFKLAVRNGQLFTASGDGVVRQHDAAKGKLVREYRGHGDWVYAIDYHAGSNRLASGSFDGEVRIWDTTTGRCVQTFTAAPGLARRANGR